MPRILVICDETKELSWLWEAPSLQNCEIETVGEDAEVLQLLRRRDFDIVVTSLTATLRLRPGTSISSSAEADMSTDLDGVALRATL
jgi:DNA-binding response OmpR family regulator